MEKNIPANPHVLTLTPFYPSQHDEISGCFVAEAIRELEAQGVASSVMAVDSIYHPRKRSAAHAPADWVRYPQWPGNLGLSSAGRFLASVVFERVARLQREHPISVIHAHAALPCGHAASILSQRFGIPYVVTIHGLDVFNRCFEDGLAARWRRWRSRQVYEQAAKVICISGKVQEVLMGGKVTRAHTAIVYNGTDPHFFSPAIDRASPTAHPATILSVGTLLAGKGQELLLRAISRLQPSHPELRCRMIGEGAHRERFAALARDLRIAERVEFLGRRSRSEVAAAMRECTLFALPSGNEGLGCVYLEAMACGKPAIGCRGQGIDEIIRHGENGWLIPVDDLDALTQGLRSLLDDERLRTGIGRAARRTIADNFTLSHQARQLAGIYREVAP